MIERVSSPSFLNMKKQYIFYSGDTLEASHEELQALRSEYESYLQNYQELFGSMEDAEYVARGNDFCDSKYSESFLESQMEKYRRRIEDIDRWLAGK